MPVLAWAVLATRDPGVVVSRSAVVTVGAPNSTLRAVSGLYRTGSSQLNRMVEELLARCLVPQRSAAALHPHPASIDNPSLSTCYNR